jgi:hypothetical protein
VAAQFWGMVWPKEVLDILLVPLLIFGLGIGWPGLQAWRRRAEFMRLLRRELKEAGPSPASGKEGCTWAHHLDKRFLHQAMMGGDSGSDPAWVLSLDQDLAYGLNQMWNAHTAAKTDPSVDLAQDWCSYLREVARRLDRRLLLARRRPGLEGTVWLSWHCLLEACYPRRPHDHTDHGHHPTSHDPGPMAEACARHHRPQAAGRH